MTIIKGVGLQRCEETHGNTTVCVISSNYKPKIYFIYTYIPVLCLEGKAGVPYVSFFKEIHEKIETMHYFVPLQYALLFPDLKSVCS